MAWIEIEEGVYGKEATPDPAKVLSTEEFQGEINRKQQEVSMYITEISNLTERKEALEAEIVEMQALISE